MSKLFQSYLTIAFLSFGSAFASVATEEIQENRVSQEEDLMVKNKTSPNECNSAQGSCSASKTSQPCQPMVLLPNQPCPENWRISGDFLYLLPTFDDTYFVLNSGTSTTFPNGKREHNDFGFKPGFRVGAEVSCCTTYRGLQAFYSRLKTSQETTVSGSNLWATLGRPDLSRNFENYAGNASSSLNLLYQKLDVNFVQRVLNSHGTYLYIQPGIEYGYFRLRENYSYQVTGATSAGIDQKSTAWGVGPQIGLGLDYNLYQGSFTCSSTQAISITSLFSGSILMGRGKIQNAQTLNGLTMLNIADERTWKTIPALHAQIGLDYLVHISNFGFSLKVGYEFNTYVRALARVIFPDDVADGLCMTNYYNFDVQGLFVSGAFSF